LPDEIRALADQILARLDEARNYYRHTRQAWRVVHDVAREGRSVGIVNEASGQEVPAADLELIAQRYVATHLTEAVFKGLAGILEDWILGPARLWLTAYPVQLDRAYNGDVNRSRAQRRDEIQVPLSDILAAPDRDAILGGVVERVVRELAYRRPAHWFRFMDNRVNLGCPDENQRGALAEVKAAATSWSITAASSARTPSTRPAPSPAVPWATSFRSTSRICCSASHCCGASSRQWPARRFGDRPVPRRHDRQQPAQRDNLIEHR
jgi:hypothetical protein